MKLSQNRVRLFTGLVTALVAIVFIVSSCNLGNSQEQAVDLTGVATDIAGIATRTPLVSGQAATVTPIPFPTRITGSGVVPTSQVLVPPVVSFPTSSPAPISIFILSPTNGNIIAGNIQVLGSASHPQFLQYRLEYGPDPNPSNLWFPITGVVQVPVIGGTLGIWNTTTAATPDGIYQLRLRVFLRDGRQEITTVNNLRVQNRAATPVPTNTPTTPRPIAAFVQDPVAGNAPLVVRFTNQSQGQIQNYTWFFGDGTTSTETSPAHSYTRAGIYTITLQVTGPGGTSNVSRQLTVTGINPPAAAFTSDKVSGPAPLAVVFTNRSTGNINGYTWDFGDGTTSTQISPSHTFSTVGTYNVILQARGEGGVSTVVRQITVSNPQVAAPVAGFTPSVTSGNAPLTVSFANTTTGTVTQYLWDFNGDGITDSTDTAPTHIYTIAGTFTVNLTAIGAGGQSSATATITVATPPQAPVASFTAAPETGDTPLTVAFTNTTTGTATSYVWDFNNDGTADSTAQNPSFTYSAAGTYTARLTATGTGGSTIADRTITVNTPIVAPDASFTPSVITGDTPLSVTFTNTSQGDSLAFEWDLNGDGTTDSTDPNPSFTYDTEGTYTVTLEASNSAGTDTATTTITVSAPVVIAPPVAAFVGAPSSGFAPLTVTFTNTSTGDGNTYAWDFNGDGTPDSTQANPTFGFTTAGTYTVTLTATNSVGSNSASQTIQANAPIPLPIAAFTANPTNGTAPLTVTFTNTTVEAIDSLSWDFNGDGIPDNTTDNSVAFPYDIEGTYTATLTVTNETGSNSTSQVITVGAALPAPNAAFTALPASGVAPLTVSFTNTTTEPVDALSWDFNADGVADNTTDNSVTFAYDVAGTYQATLTVTNSSGSDSISQTITVQTATPAPIAAFTAAPTTGNAPLTVTFTNNTAEPVDTFTWDFDGDGIADNTTDNSATFTYNTVGEFTATLTVTNASGTDSISQVISVTEATPAPIASFTAVPTTGNAPLTVTFTNNTAEPVDTFTWDFDGDGIADNTTDNIATFTYNTVGDYTATLTVTNASGTDSISQVISVTEATPAPIAAFTADPISGNAPLSVSFRLDTVEPVDTFTWDFNGDGITDNSIDLLPTFTYDVAGTYNVTLAVTNVSGTDSISQTITVNELLTPPQPSFTASPNTGTAPLTVNFDNTSGGQVDSLSWDFNGDGIPDDTTSDTPQFTYDTDGTYDVTLSVTNTSGTETTTQQIIVEASTPAPVSLFTVDQSTGNAPFTVTFSNTTVEPIDTFSWDFNGDGTADNTADLVAVFTYDTAGTYAASLTVTNEAGTDTSTQTITINNAAQTTPNGNIVFTSNRDGNYEIYSINDDSSNPFNLTQNGTDDTAPVWTPDGNRIIFVSNRDGNEEIYVMNADGTNATRLTNDNGSDDLPSVSPDATKIAFVSNRTGDNEIWVMNADGSGQTQLTFSPADDTQPAWNGNSQIVFASNSVGNYDIYSMGSDGSALAAITLDVSEEFEPDVREGVIVFVSTRSGDQDVFTMNIDGTNVVQLTTSSGDDQQPKWSADGTISFTSDRDTGNNDVYLMGSDGSNQRNITNNGVDDSQSDRK